MEKTGSNDLPDVRLKTKFLVLAAEKMLMMTKIRSDHIWRQEQELKGLAIDVVHFRVLMDSFSLTHTRE